MNIPSDSIQSNLTILNNPVPSSNSIPSVSSENDTVSQALDELQSKIDAEYKESHPSDESNLNEFSLVLNEFNLKSKLQRIKSILEKGMDSQQVIQSLIEIERIITSN